MSDSSTSDSGSGTSSRYTAAFFLNLLGTLVTYAAVIAATFLIVDALLVLFGASQKNDVAKFFRHVADPLAWVFKNLFTFKKHKYTVGLNYVIAAVVYLVVGILLGRLIKRVAP